MPRLVENALVVYTDGSLVWKGRKGGYGLVFLHIDERGSEAVVFEHAPPGIAGTTGNRMELQACVDALEFAPKLECFRKVAKLVIRSDSQYVVRGHKALPTWQRLGWRNIDGRPIDNPDVWKDFLRALKKVRKSVVIEWVKGHGKGKDKDPHNYAADGLAKSSRNNVIGREFRSSVRRKIAPGKTLRGSVKVFGQTFVIYVVEVQRMRVQKTWKYRYQVASTDSSDCNAIDWIYSNEQMRDGHFYEVRVNDNMKYPQVLEVLRE
ncbi:MAG: ribonuclease, partial [Betaproteobacteria bacterium]|nr:ribonuclease [Betaproteobacteria bacterium]